jgi:hypothetical protein
VLGKVLGHKLPAAFIGPEHVLPTLLPHTHTHKHKTNIGLRRNI